MIAPSSFLDPRGKPANGKLPFIGGPLDGGDWPMQTPLHINPTLRQQHGGQYCYADMIEWAYVWVPDDAQ